jgi:hypothetical protein
MPALPEMVSLLMLWSHGISLRSGGPLMQDAEGDWHG